MMSSRTAGSRGKPKRYGKPWRSAYELADWNSIRRRRKSSIARTSFGEERNRTRSLTFSGIPFGRGNQSIVRGSSSSTSVQRSRTKPRRPSETRFGAGTCPDAGIKASKTCHGGSIQSSAGGSKITGDLTARHSIPLPVPWTEILPSGPRGNTRSCAIISAGRRGGSRAFRDVIRSCLPTGRWGCGVAL